MSEPKGPPDPYVVLDSSTVVVPARTWRGPRDWNHSAVYLVCGRVVRVTIRVHYEERSLGKAEAFVYSPAHDEWHYLASIPKELRRSEHLSYEDEPDGARNYGVDPFAHDTQALMVDAVRILSAAHGQKGYA